MLGGQPAARGRRLAARHGLPARHQLAARPRSVAKAGKAEDQRHAHHLPGRPRSTRACSIRSRSRRAPTASTSRPTASTSSSPASSTRTSRSTASRRSRARSPTENFEARRVRRADPATSTRASRPGRARPGPLHTQFDDKGYAYTSLFLDSAVARWKLGGSGVQAAGSWSSKMPVHYNIGHLTVAEGDTVSARRQVPGRDEQVGRSTASSRVGPLHPQNFQLIDICRPADRCSCSTTCRSASASRTTPRSSSAEKIKAWTMLPRSRLGPARPRRCRRTRQSRQDERRRARRQQGHGQDDRGAQPLHARHRRGKEGDEVTWHITNIEQAQDATHGFALPGANLNLSHSNQAKPTTVSFIADKPGNLPLLLHGVLLGAPPGDDGLLHSSARETLTGKARMTTRTAFVAPSVAGDGRLRQRHPSSEQRLSDDDTRSART